MAHASQAMNLNSVILGTVADFINEATLGDAGRVLDMSLPLHLNNVADPEGFA
jgi:hypothetical protein